ncbi:MAG: Uma2 family endonuclease [Oculatellaceae cyanobacterium bins.114]|nr:Uma2 family endonuclease [Oculatellaceae cyanobacterium bins.114]
MTVTRPSLEQVDPPRSPRETLPTMYDLPSEDPNEPGLPDEFHDLQPQLLSATLRLTGYPRNEIFTGTNLYLYYDVRHPLWQKRPDWFLVVGVPRLYDGVDLRSSYVIWQEGIDPFVVVELLSPGTQAEDLGTYAKVTEAESGLSEVTFDPEALTPENDQPQRDVPPSKWNVYEKVLRVPYYIVFSRYTNKLWFFKQVGGRYEQQPLASNPPQIWIPELALGLGLWQGDYMGISRSWLRWCDAEGNWVLTPEEQVEQEQQRSERLAERLRQLGVDPDQV